MLTFFYRLLIAVLLIGGSISAVILLIHHLYEPERRRNHTLENRVDITELFVSLEFIITTEIELYEGYLRNNTTTDLTTINNTEFINIYKDLSRKCLEAPSPQFWELAEIYMSRASIQTYITQRVYNYLADKVKE